MKKSSKDFLAGLTCIILIICLVLVSYKIINGYMMMAERVGDQKYEQEPVMEVITTLKSWGGLILGFLFGAGFNFIVMVFLQGARKGHIQNEDGEI